MERSYEIHAEFEMNGRKYCEHWIEMIHKIYINSKEWKD